MATVPANLILARWPTGPDQRIVESNPLYQYARSNVPIEDDELWAKPMIHAFITRFFYTYDLLPNMLATAFWYTPHQETYYFREGAEYYREPPNVNGQFAALHHNFYVETCKVNVYDANRVLPQHIINTYDYAHNHQVQEMSDVDRINHVDTAFLNCRDAEERTVLYAMHDKILNSEQYIFQTPLDDWKDKTTPQSEDWLTKYEPIPYARVYK
eukprot:scaffold275133_cov65-Attheya_sp.AAC.3